MIGERLGPYEITGKLGEGGMGVVYRALDPRLERDVAIKVLPPEVARDAERLRRFEIEARAASALNHPNILTVHDTGTSDGTTYLVTELLEGRSLRELLADGPLAAERACALAVQVAGGLAAAHRKGIVHRDLKPENLFVTADGRAKILDFGLARLEAPEAGASGAAVPERSTVTGTAAGMLLGTVGYMAPEQVRGERADARSDLFALGVVLCEMLTGANPFARPSAVESLHAILKEPPSPIAAAGIPPAVEATAMRCLEKDPERRFQSASDLAFALESAGSGERRAAPPPPVGSGASGTRPSRGLRLAGALAALLAVAGLGWWLRQRSASTASAESAAAPAIRSIAVLPFASLSPESADEYFSDGMTDALTVELARLRELKLIARNSTARFRGSTLAPAAIAGELGVEGLLSGSVLRAGERVRISAQLTEAKSDRIVWAESYERAVSDVLTLQGEVARDIAGAIALQLSPAETTLLASARPVDPRALDEYLQGRALWTRRTEEGVTAALGRFEAALAIDPKFALGQSGLADAYTILAAYNWMEPRRALPLAVAAAERAQALDPGAGEPLASRGDLAIHWDRDLALARKELRRALELSPGNAVAYHWLGEAALVGGATDEAIGHLRRAIELDPQAPAPHLQLAMAYEGLGRVEEAERTYRRALEISPGFASAAGGLVRIELADGRGAAALAAAERTANDDPSVQNRATVAVALAWTGETARAREILEALRAERGERWVSPYEIACVEAALGEGAAALANLRQAVEASVFQVQSLSIRLPLEFSRFDGDPELEAIRASIWRVRYTP
ncbi:MAG: protein kinase [Thermoanaerobaculia bacterium]